MLKRRETSIWVKIIGTPLVGFIYLGALGSFFWLDALYGIGVAALLPYLLIHAFA